MRQKHETMRTPLCSDTVKWKGWQGGIICQVKLIIPLNTNPEKNLLNACFLSGCVWTHNYIPVQGKKQIANITHLCWFKPLYLSLCFSAGLFRKNTAGNMKNESCHCWTPSHSQKHTHTHTNTLKLTRPWQRSAEEVKQTLSTSVKDSTHSQTDTESSLWRRHFISTWQI